MMGRARTEGMAICMYLEEHRGVMFRLEEQEVVRGLLVWPRGVFEELERRG